MIFPKTNVEETSTRTSEISQKAKDWASKLTSSFMKDPESFRKVFLDLQCADVGRVRLHLALPYWQKQSMITQSSKSMTTRCVCHVKKQFMMLLFLKF